MHTREARADTLALLREASLPQAGVLHCFTEDWEMAGPLWTLVSTSRFRASSPSVMPTRCVTSPGRYLPIACWWRPIRPISHRFPTVARPICRSTCARWPSSRAAAGVSFEQLAEQTTANFRSLFRLPGFAAEGHGFRACNLPDLPRAAHFVFYPQGGVMTAETLHTGPLQRGLKTAISS